METLGNIKGAKKSSVEYYCDKCDFICFKKFNWDRHLSTSKHLEELKWNKMEIKQEQKEQSFKLCICEKCNKEFQTTSGLWKHKQKCNHTTIANNEPSDKELIMMLIKENSELKNMMIKVLENGTNSGTDKKH